jgi:transcriptional regulator GlxA family with amidase domain
LRLAIDDFERDGLMLSSPITMQQFEQLVFTNLLLSHPHNHTQSLRRLAKLVASGDVKRAIDYIEANLTLPIGLPDITAAAGVPGRTLLEHFRRYKGVSPMGYLRRARFAKMREALCSAEPEESVTRIAMGQGFSRIGRFSVEYRRRFGESPSETLRQRRHVLPGPGAPSWSGRVRDLADAAPH